MALKVPLSATLTTLVRPSCSATVVTMALWVCQPGMALVLVLLLLLLLLCALSILVGPSRSPFAIPHAIAPGSEYCPVGQVVQGVPGSSSSSNLPARHPSQLPLGMTSVPSQQSIGRVEPSAQMVLHVAPCARKPSASQVPMVPWPPGAVTPSQ
jgi:hypothetical protein